MLGLGARADAHQELAALLADRAVEPERVAKIGVRALVERPREADPWLDREDGALPGDRRHRSQPSCSPS